MQPRTAEGQGDGHPQQVVGVGPKLEIEGRLFVGRGGLARLPREGLKLVASLVPIHGHEGQDKVGLVEALARAVDAHEHLRDLFLRHFGNQLQNGEVIRSRQTVELLQRLLDARHVVWTEAALTPKLLIAREIFRHDAEKIGIGFPDGRNVREPRRVFWRGGVGNHEFALQRIESDTDIFIFVVVAQDRLALDDRIEAGGTLLAVHDEAVGNGAARATATGTAPF